MNKLEYSQRGIHLKLSAFDTFAAFALATMLSACVTQTTVETKVPDQAAPSDVAFKAKLHTERAGEYYRIGNYGVAIDAANQALAAVPGYAPAHNMLGIIYLQLGEDAKAKQSLEKALQLAPNDSEVLNNYGWYVCQRQNPSQAMQYFQAALRNPLYNSPERALHNAGLCARKAGDMAQAEAQLRAALQRQPGFAPALLDLSDLLYGQGRIKEAESQLARHMQIVTSPSADALLLGVRLARATGDKTSEVGYVSQLRRRFPDSPQAKSAMETR